MSWKQSNLTLRLPQLSGWSFGDTLWIGTGNDAGYYLFQLNNKWIIADKLYPTLKTFSTTFYPLYQSINSVNYWEGGNYYLWYNGYWIISKTAGFGITEDWKWNNEDDHTEGGYYSGDEWYSSYSLPAVGESVVFYPRGSKRGTTQNAYESSNEIEVSASFDYWQYSERGDAPAGIYAPMSDQSGNKIVGIPQWTDQDDTEYTRSLEKDDNGHYTYGTISYDKDNEKWLIGTYESNSGWWEGEEPSISESVTFEFTINDDSNAEGDDIILEFDQYVIGDNTEDRYIGEAPIWL